MNTTSPRKKLIEVALPLDAINTASAREKSIRHGHPSTLHLWWARRPLAAARAVLFAQWSTTHRPGRSCFQPRQRNSANANGCSASSNTWSYGSTPPTRRYSSAPAAKSGGAGRGTAWAGRRQNACPTTRSPGHPYRTDPAAAGRARSVCRWRFHPARSATAGAGGVRQRPQPGGGDDQQGNDRNSAEVPRLPAGQSAGSPAA